MGLVLPPPPLSKEEVEKRVRAGATTNKEIDPAFHQLCRSRARHHCFVMTVVILSILAIMAAFVIVMIRKGGL